MSQPRKICLVNDSFPPVIDGVANAVVNYANVITHSGRGCATVVTPYYPGANDAAFDFFVLRYPSLDLTSLVGYRAGLPFSPELMQALEQGGFELIHSHCPVTSTIVSRLLRERIHVPLVFTYHTKFDIDIANAIHGKLLQEAAEKLLVQNISACDEVWTVSHGAGENLRSMGYQGDYIVMPNGVDFPVGRVDRSEVDKACAGLDLPEDIPLFLFVGRMMWYKGIRIILDALKQLDDGGLSFRMVFIGKGGDSTEIESYAAQLGLEQKVLFLPPIYDREVIRAWYCRADLFLFPSTFDTNGLVVREAAACALPSVLVRGSCAAEDSTDGQNSFLIEENAPSMAALLRQIAYDRPLLRRVGEHAQRELYLSWEDAVHAACDRYEIVLDRYRRGLYPVHDAPSDELLEAAADILSAINRSRDRRRQIAEDVSAGVQQLHAEAQENRTRFRERMDDFLDRFL
ncbi:MAG: glycosyltransferase [Oscillospiraceae bacterium]|nr:glycosyltransferase [Oscillospiraceae bacterium]